MTKWIDFSLSDARLTVDDSGNVTGLMGWAVISRDLPTAPWYKRVHRLALARVQRTYGDAFVVRDNAYALRSPLLTPQLFAKRLEKAYQTWEEELSKARRELKDLELLGVDFKEEKAKWK